MTTQEQSHSQTWRVSPDLLGIVNQAGVFVETNPAWQTVLGWSVAEIRSMVFPEFVHPDDLESTLALFGSMKEGAVALHFENRYRCKDGSFKWLSWVAVPEDDVFVCSARDITADKSRATALKSSEDEAKLREQFVAILSHDLRNPLASIGSAVRIAARQPHNTQIAEMLTSINASTDRMARLIDVTMDFARARLGGGIPVELQPNTDLKTGFEQVIDEISLAHPDRKIETSLGFEGVLHCDAGRLDQLLSNLIANAVTHGSGNAPICVQTTKQKDHFVLSVSNAGNPIPQNLMPTLFEPFKRSGKSESLQGLGLGLYIADQIARAHHGRIVVTSGEAETVFKLEIPLDVSN
jgi:PAS domain S-box-containing protein